MKWIVFLLEEPSAKEMLRGILPRLLTPDIHTQFIVFEGKQDLEKRLVPRVQHWLKPNSKFVVIRDQDSGNCHTIKQQLAEKLKSAGRPDALIRIACRELETFYLGDLQAVETGLDCKGLVRLQRNAKYRNPDNLANACEELMKRARYQKLAGSRAIAHHLKLDGSNRSSSFNVLVRGLRRIIASFQDTDAPPTPSQ